MAYVTLDDLRQKGVLGATYDMQNNAWQTSGGSRGDRAYYAELIKQAQGLMESLGVKPDAASSYSSDSGDFSRPYYSSDLIERTLRERGLQMGVDPTKSSGKLGGSGSWTLQMGLLDAEGKPVQEFQTGEKSIGSSFFKGFVAPFASIVLTGNAKAIGAAIAPTASATVQSAIGSAVASGAGTALSGGDAEDVIKNALIGGATGAIGEMVKPYVQDAIDFVKDLSPEGLENVVAAAEGAEDVAGAVTDVDVGGVGDVGAVDLGADPLYGGAYTGSNTAQSYSSLTDYGKDVYAGELALGKSPDAALISAFRAESLNFPTTGNALATGGAAAGGNALATDQNALAGNALASAADQFNFAGFTGPQFARYEDLVSSGLPPDIARAQVLQEFGTLDVGAITGGSVTGAVTPNGGVATVDLTAGQTAGQTAGAGTVADTGAGLGAAGTAAGVAGAGAAAAGAAGAGAGTAAGAGGDMIDLGTDPLYGGAYTGSGAAESALTGAAAGAGAAAGLTGIPVVDDFLKYIGTPAGAAALGAFGSLAGGYLTGQAAKDAANIQAQSAANALKLQEDQFEYQKSLLEPYRARGESALNRLAGVMGLDGQPAQPQQLLDMDPGYAFRLGEGMKALERVQAARGNMLSGGAIKAGQRYAQDFASGEYGNAYNRLANIAGLGQTVGGQLGSAAQQFGQTAGETMSQGANALAAGRVGRMSGYMGGIGGAVGAFQNYQNQQQQNQLFRDIYGRMGG